MLPPKHLASIVQSSLLGPSSPSPAQKVELIHAIRNSFSTLQNLLSYLPPKPSDRAEVESREVRLPDSPPISLDDQDVEIALKLSDDLCLNEIDCVRLLVSTNQEWGLMGRDPLEIRRLALGLWYMERRHLLSTLYTLLRVVVLDQELDSDLMSDIQNYVEDLIQAGLRHRLISLIKDLNLEEPAGLGGPQSERFLIDARDALVERRAVVSRERLILGHCLVYSMLVVRAGPKDVKQLFLVLKDSAAELGENIDTVKHQIIFSLLFSLVITLISDAICAEPDKSSVLAHDPSFRKEFHDIVMDKGNDLNVEGYVAGARFAWAVHLMLTCNEALGTETVSGSLTNELDCIYSCLESVFASNIFQFLLDKVLRTASYKNDEEDIVYIYNAYLHKLITCFLSHPLARDKVKESKDKAMSMLNMYKTSGSHDHTHHDNMLSVHAGEMPLPFISLLEFVSTIYQNEPELLSGNDVMWTFVSFAGEDHTNFQTLVAFLQMLSTLATTMEGASKVYDLLRGKAFRSIGWETLFDCLRIYDEKFKQAPQTVGAMLPEFQEGDAKALVAYLDVLEKVIRYGNPIETKNWFPDIEPLFKLLGYENVPPYLKGALRNAIATFVHAFPELKDHVWRFLEQHDLPVVAGSLGDVTSYPVATQIYDMQFELNEIEARREQYPSTISFLNLVNVLIAGEKDLSDRGRRFIGIFRFVYDHVFAPFPQRAYSDSNEKWKLVVACLQHFHMILSMYEIQDDDIDSVLERSQSTLKSHPSALQMQLPIVELLKDFMSGRTVFRNIMSILQLGVDSVIRERAGQIYGQVLENAVKLSLEIIVLAFEKDSLVSDFWRPLYQPLDVILCQDHNQIISLLEYVRYESLPQIQQCSVKIMSILSSRIVGLVQLLIKSNAAGSLIQDYAACLELRSEEVSAIENSLDDSGVLIMHLLIDNISRPAPNVTHLLLKFDLDNSVERSVLQPKFHYSCLKVILEMLEKLSNAEANYLLHEFGFQLLYELCLDPLTSVPTLDLLSTKKYQFFVKHINSIGIAPLPKRSSNLTVRISSLHQRAWMLKLLAAELHVGYGGNSSHQEACNSIVSHLFGSDLVGKGYDQDGSGFYASKDFLGHAGTVTKIKVLELLEILQFRSPDTSMKLSDIVSKLKYDLMVENLLENSNTSQNGGVYYYSERGDRLIDLPSFSDKLWQRFNSLFSQANNSPSEAELNDARETIQHFLRWGWKYNKNLEEQAAQLHMLAGWSQIAEVSASRRISSFDNRSDILYQILDASVTASSSPDCSLKMAFVLSQVALTCMAKLRDERFQFDGGLNSDSVSCLDIITLKQLSNGACHSLLIKLIMAILRLESSEALRRRQYALLLSYFQYCQQMLALDMPKSVLQFLLLDDRDGDDLDVRMIEKEEAELSRSNFAILRNEAQALLDVLVKDASQGSEPGKTISLYVLDAFVCVDHERYFLNQLQSRGFLRFCLANISQSSFQDGVHGLHSLQRASMLEALLAFLLRISYKYGKSGAQVMFSMGALDHFASFKAVNHQGSSMFMDLKLRGGLASEIDKHRILVTNVLRLVLSLTALVDTSEFFEVKNKVVREAIDFVKGHQILFHQILKEDISAADELLMEQIHLSVGILSKVWPYEEADKYGFVQVLFGMMCRLFSWDWDSTAHQRSFHFAEIKSQLKSFNLCFSLVSYLYFLVLKTSLRLQVSDSLNCTTGLQQPTLHLLVSLLSVVTKSLEKASEEKYSLFHKIRDVNELSRKEVDEIINMCKGLDMISSSENIQKRRYIAMVEMCRFVGVSDQLITLSINIVELVLNIILIHFKESDLAVGNDMSMLCGNLVPIMERLELLHEAKVGHDLKVFRRLVASVKEMGTQRLSA